MRVYTLLAALLLTSTASQAQSSLTVSAGPDKAWCSTLQGTPADTPVLGGSPTASGGTAPYVYQWSLLYTDYRGNHVSPMPSAFLRNDQSANPTMLQKTGTDSARAIVQVTDASGRIARDTTWLYFQTIMCTTGNDPVISKQPADTVTLFLTGGGCMSNFRPYTDYRWRPADDLVDSTVQFARCYTPVSRRYTLYVRDRIGCPLHNSLDVIVQPVSITNTAADESSLSFDATTRTILIHGTNQGQIQLVDLNGQVVWDEAISGNASLPVPASLPSGMYIGVLRSEKGKILLRQKLAL
ncbi:MAG: T9SS type A sorting domain-containing protein [Sphingobacteriales bacterium]|nr:MAG: T9SS type A sorting domain-containing protein [Sphingobacteriales bacterium]